MQLTGIISYEGYKSLYKVGIQFTSYILYTSLNAVPVVT